MRAITDPSHQCPAAWSRRQMLASAACTIAACGAVRWPVASAEEPIQRNGTPKFKFSLAAYSYRDLLQKLGSGVTLASFVEDCAAFGLEGVELTSYYFPADVSDDDLRNLRRQCFRLGLDVSGTAVGNDFGHEPGSKESQHAIEHVQLWCRRAEILGAPVIRIFAGQVPSGVDAEVAHGWMVEAIQRCCETAGNHGVHLALENHGGPTADVAGLLKIVKDVKSPWFGVNLDTGNFQSKQVYDDLALAAPFALNVQVKVVTSDGEGHKTPTDFPRLAQLLRAAAYRGYIVLEYEESDDPRAACPKHLAQIKAAFS